MTPPFSQVDINEAKLTCLKVIERRVSEHSMEEIGPQEQEGTVSNLNAKTVKRIMSAVERSQSSFIA